MCSLASQFLFPWHSEDQRAWGQATDGLDDSFDGAVGLLRCPQGAKLNLSLSKSAFSSKATLIVRLPMYPTLPACSNLQSHVHTPFSLYYFHNDVIHVHVVYH